MLSKSVFKFRNNLFIDLVDLGYLRLVAKQIKLLKSGYVAAEFFVEQLLQCFFYRALLNYDILDLSLDIIVILVFFILKLNRILADIVRTFNIESLVYLFVILSDFLYLLAYTAKRFVDRFACKHYYVDTEFIDDK